MKKSHTLHFNCLSCQSPIHFSVFELSNHDTTSCQTCSKHYTFNDPILLRQLKKFETLCRSIHDAEEILGSACIGVDVGEHHVKVPYKLLLTRLKSSLDLHIGTDKISISFRIEPIQDPHVASIQTSNNRACHERK